MKNQLLDRSVRFLAPILAAGLFLAGPGLAQQTTGNLSQTSVHIGRTIPAEGATGIALDRPTLIRFTLPIDDTTVDDQSIRVSSGGIPIETAYTVPINNRGVRVDYPEFMPAESLIEVLIDGDLLLDLQGRPIDADHDGNPGGQFLLTFNTGVGPPLTTDTAFICGRVFDQNGAPLQGAIVDAVLFPSTDNTPPLPVPPGITDANGQFGYTTPVFTGTETFLVRVRNGADWSEALHKVTILAGGCWTLKKSYLMPISPKVPVDMTQGAMLTDPTGQIELEIPPNALQQNSDIGITILNNFDLAGNPTDDWLRDDVPPLVSMAGTFVDVNGVFGDATNLPVTMRVPNIYDLPVGTRIPLGKIDHNTLDWVDLRDAWDGPGPAPDEFLGEVVSDGQGGSVIEIQFDHFCSVCTGYCLPLPCDEPKDVPPPGGGGGGPGPGGGGGPPPGGGGPPAGPIKSSDFGQPGTDGVPSDHNEPPNPSAEHCGSSSVNLGEGFLSELVELPTMKIYGRDFGVRLAYFSGAADPSVTLTGAVDFLSTRPVERTIFQFKIEGHDGEGAYAQTANDVKPIGRWIWDGTTSLGNLLPTGSYPLTVQMTSINAEVAVAVSDFFGETSIQQFNTLEYPGLVPLRTSVVERRATLVNLQDSPYGAGWSVMEEYRLHFDADGCVVLRWGNGAAGVYTPSPSSSQAWVSRDGDPTLLTRDPVSGEFTRTHPDGTVEVYTTDGLLQTVTDRYGLVTSYAYGANDLLVSITGSTGHQISFGYTGGKLSSISDSAGRTTTFQVDSNGDLTSVTDASGTVRTFAYDADHRMTDQFLPSGARSEYVYTWGRISATRNYDTNGTTLLRERMYQPQALNGEITSSLAMGLGTLQFPIDITDQRVTASIDGRGVTELTETNCFGQVIRTVDGLGNETAYERDPIDLRLVGRTRPDGTRTEYDYNAAGKATAIREYSGPSTLHASFSFEYGGPFGELTRYVDALGKETVYAYDALGNRTSVTDHAGNAVQSEYSDALHPHLPTRRIFPDGSEIRMVYDAHGNMQTFTDFPDPQGQPNGRQTSFTFDAAGNLATVTDPDGGVTQFFYDAMNRVTETRDAFLSPTLISYDDAGCSCATDTVTQVTLPGGGVLDFEYDGLDRLITQTDQAGQDTLFEYDGEGNVTLRTNRAGETVQHTYDEAGNVVRTDLSTGEVTIFEYDARGRVTSAIDAQCKLGFAYGPYDQVTRATTELELPLGNNVTANLLLGVDSTYDAMGNRLALEDDTGVADYVYQYDDLHRLTSLVLTNVPNASWALGYDTNGRRDTVVAQASGVTSTWAYDGAAQVDSIGHASTRNLTFDYTQYDGTGDLQALSSQISTGALNATAAYDATNRLVQSVYSVLYGDAQPDRAYVYDAANRLLSDGALDYTYDAEGRLLTRQEIGSDVTDHFSWNAAGQLVRFEQIWNDGQNDVTVLTADYVYDPLGRRVAKDVNGVVTRYVYDGDDLLHEIDKLDRVARSYVHGPATDDHLGVLNLASGELYAYHVDRLGSPIAMSDSNGDVVQEWVYDEFGNLAAELEPRLHQAYGFTGRERDLESGLYYYRERYYDTAVGRFVSEDPLGLEAGRNFYTYVRNNPVNSVDPFGLEGVDCREQECYLLHTELCESISTGNTWGGAYVDPYDGTPTPNLLDPLARSRTSTTPPARTPFDPDVRCRYNTELVCND